MRVLLINPPSPESTGAPLLGQQYVAAALLEEGCDVRLIDAAARFFPHNAEWIAQQAHDFQPHVIGIGLFTRWVWHAYQLAAHLRHGPWTLLAGGAHATVRPEETLRHGFHAALTGEAEVSIRHFVRVIATGGDLAQIPGIVFRQSDGATAYGPPAAFLEDLDSLAPPHKAQPLYAPHWHTDSGATMTPGGILTSRGCPARCTFCANHVTGRRFRHRSPSNITAELNAWHAQTTHTFFPFWDDAFTANPSRLTALCEAFQRDLHFPLSFSAITRANMVTPGLLRTMRRAGLIHVNFGVESGDDNILRAIRKGIRTDHVVQALEWAKDEGLITACNFMLGFPQETEIELERTLRFMQKIAPLVDTFSTMGVLVPFPGTPLYDDYHFQYGFTDWWLREDFSRYQAPPPITDSARFHRYYIDDTNLGLDFFRYSPAVRRMIRQCLRFKAEHNMQRMGLLPALGVA